MPCEDCQVQFTVFRRKRSCNDCRRYYCSNCLHATKRRNNGTLLLCQRCAIFAKRPLMRADLLQLKPKDLIFYLQSKHISTAGCVEKDELISLVLNHAQQSDAHGFSGQASPEMHSHASADTTNSFDSLKQTCQNFFTNISDNLTESFSNLDGRGNAKTQQQQQSQRSVPTMEQPRVYTREMPSYAEYQNRMRAQTQMPTAHSAHVSPASEHAATTNNTNNSSPTFSASSAHNANDVHNATSSGSNSSTTASASKQQDNNGDCDCSDDELIADFSARHAIKTDTTQAHAEQQSAAAAGTTTAPTSSRIDVCGDTSSQSSFEELGAIGGTSEDSRPTTDTNSSVNMEQWLVVEVASTSAASEDSAMARAQQAAPAARMPPQTLATVVRRRSDSYLSRRHELATPTSPNIAGANANLNQSAMSGLALDADLNACMRQEATTSRPRLSCTRCGKSKANLRQQVEKMRQHLESAQMSDEDIKREIADFLEYLELRTKSLDQSDSETVGSSLSAANLSQIAVSATTPADDNDGIHVYATAADCDAGGSRFIKLADFDQIAELENLTVKQLKEILMLHRVDYKGCCEKQELLERVSRLWRNLKSAPAVDKLATDELCKICMDAPIECVILECGHMATCTSCGKVLSECPICRQYIVRVVRFFRA